MHFVVYKRLWKFYAFAFSYCLARNNFMSKNTLVYALSLTTNDEPDFAASISHYAKTFDVDTRFLTISQHEFLGLHFNLSGDFMYTVNDVHHGRIRRGSFNLIYIAAKTRIEYRMKPGSCQMFSIGLPIKFLQFWNNQYPLLPGFLEKVIQKEAAMISPTYHPITGEIYRLILEMLNDRNIGKWRNISLRPKIFDLIPPCLQSIHADGVAQVRGPDGKKIKQVHDYIVQNLQYHHSMDFLADKFDIDKRKLAAGFKKVYKTTVVNFLIEERMKKAKELLQIPTMSLQDIAAAIGYTRQQNFSDIFRKKFGQSPISYRRDALNPGTTASPASGDTQIP
jgi:AraC family transcriptional activator of pyochelin receptor